MGSYRQLEGMQNSPERDDRVTPVAEHVEGVVNPYRGMETHGVDPTKGVDAQQDYELQDYTDENGDIIYAPEEEEPEPVAVRIVQGHSGKERLDWRALRVVATEIGQQLVGRHDRRRSITVHVDTGSQSVYLGPDSGVSTYTGYKLLAGESLVLRTTENIWAITAPTEQSNISVAWEYGLEIQ